MIQDPKMRKVMRDTWHNMIHRCHNPQHKAYANYGGRGIKVCDRWRDKDTGFANFVADVKVKPDFDHSLDRINNDGHYEPDNVRWATRSEQQRNRRLPRRRGKVNMTYTYKGVTLTAKNWAEQLGIKPGAFRARRADGLPDEAIFYPGQLPRGMWTRNPVTKQYDDLEPKWLIEWRGETKPVLSWSKEVGISSSTLRARISSGWSVEKAFTTPVQSRPSKGGQA